MAPMISPTALFGMRAFFLLATVVFTIGGVAGNVLTGDTDDKYLTYWKFSDAGVTIKTKDLGCEGLRQRLKGGGGTSIVFLLLQSLLLAMIVAEYFLKITSKAFRAAFYVICALTFIFGLPAWGLGATVYNQELCQGFVPKNQGYDVGYGIALLVTSWVIFTLVTIGLSVYAHFCAATEESEPSVAAAPKPAEDKKVESANTAEALPNNAPDAV